MSDHRGRYKGKDEKDPRELRRRREEDTVQLRRAKRDHEFIKKRTLEPTNDFINNGNGISDSQIIMSGGFIGTVGGDECDNSLQLDLSDQHLTMTKETIDGLMQDDDLQLLIENAQKVRKILSKEPQPPFEDVIQSGLMPRFMVLLDRDDQPKIQFEVAWIITNICSGTTEQTRSVVEHGAIPKLVRLCASPDPEVYEQSVWALGNVIGDGPDLRDIVIKHNFVPALLRLLDPKAEIKFLRNLTWVIVNLCRNKDPPPAIEVIQQIIPALSYLIQCDDMAILVDTAWAASYITELGIEYSQLIIDSGLVQLIIPLLSHPEIKIQTAAIRALGSIATGDERQTQALIDAGALPHIYRLLKDSKSRIVKEAIWFLSNVSAGEIAQIQAIIDNNIVPLIVYHLSEGEFTQQKEAAWVIYNMCVCGSEKQIQVLLEENVIEPLCNLLNIKDAKMVKKLLEAITSILNACHETNPDIVLKIEACGGLDKIESLLSSDNNEIYEAAYGIIETYFPEDEQ